MSQVSIRRVGTDRPRLELEMIGDDEVTGGDAQWTLNDRAGRNPMTVWEGTTAVTWTLPLTFDNFDEGSSVERQVAQLASWREPGDNDDQPPHLVVNAPAGRAPSTKRWVIQSIEWGDQIRNGAGNRVRQDLRLTLLEYEPGDVRKGPAAKSRNNGKKHKWVPVGPKDRRCKVCKRPRDDKRHSNR